VVNNTRVNRRKGRAFTLIELMVVITIIGVLAALLFPTFGMVREKARRVSCLSNLKQFSIAIMAYAAENNGWLPPPVDPKPEWIGVSMRNSLMNYGMTRAQFYCPSLTDYAKTWNTTANWDQTAPNATLAIGFLYFGRRQGFASRLMDNPTNTLLLCDLSRKMNGAQWDRAGTFGTGVAHPVFRGYRPEGSNHVFLDGTARWIGANEFLNQPPIYTVGVDSYAKPRP
jgi:prepilin-type N-terminal cleavage/methylation domain-containing protein